MSVGIGRSAADSIHVSDSAQAGVLLNLGPATVRSSASLELKVIRASKHPAPPAEATPSVEVGITRKAWLIGTSTAMGGVSQIVAPGNRLAGLIGLAVGYAWAEWIWRNPS